MTTRSGGNTILGLLSMGADEGHIEALVIDAEERRNGRQNT